MELACERRNLKAALERVRKNKGSPGIDGMTVEELPDFLREHWLAIREDLLTGRYQPSAVRRVAIPKPGGGERELRNIDKWIRHRLRALQLKQWKRGTTIYRELVSRGMSAVSAATVARNAQRWWHDSAMKIHIALPNAYFDKLGLPRLAA
jgi:hypothetical protein